MKTVDFKSTLLENIEKPTQRVDFKAVDPTHNEGGILGGIGYVTGKMLTGIASVGEGITDLVAGGIAELSGDHRRATYIFGHSEVGEWNKALDDWYNPDGVMEVVGEIGGAVGNSLAFAGATAAGTAIGAPWLGYAVIGASGVGGGIGEAVQETGQLGAKEYIFGTLAGATELGLEAFTGATVKAGARLAGKGASKVGASVVGKRVLSNSTRRGFIRTTVTEASEEFIEEFASTYANVAWRHVTGVDPDAQYSLGDATYAGLIGFVSGGLMSGTSQGVQNAISGHRGARIMDNGNTDTMLNTAKYVIGKFGSDTAVKSKQNVTDALVQLTNAYEAYGKLKDKSGVRAKLYLGEMQRASAQLEARARAMYASDEFLGKAKADPAEAERYAKVLNAVLQPETAFTAEDIVNNKELSKGTSVCDMLGYMKFAGEFMDETRRKAEYAEAMQEAEDAANVMSEESAEEELPFVETSDQQSAESTEAPTTQESALAVPQTEAGEGRQSPAPTNAQETQNLPSSEGSAPETVSTPDAQASVAPVAQSGEGTSEQSPETANAQEKENSAPAAEAVTRTNDEKAQVTEKAPTAESADTAQGEGIDTDMDAVADELRADIIKARSASESVEAAKKQTSEKTSAKDGKRGTAQFSMGAQKDSREITIGTTDAQRYEILKGREMKVYRDSNSSAYAEEITSLEQLNTKAKSKAEEIIIPLARKLKINEKTLTTADIDIDFTFSMKSVSRSLSHQLEYGGSYADFAKAVVNLERILENAVLIEVHSDKYKGTVREDPNLEKVYVLLGVLADGEHIVPIQFEVKKFYRTDASLYLTVSLAKVDARNIKKEADVMGKVHAEEQQFQSLLSASVYSISEIVKKINPSDENFLKYLPDEFLSAEQIEGKQRGIAKEKAKIEKLKRGRAQFSIPAAEPGDTRKEIDRALDAVTLYTQTKKESASYELDDDTYAVEIIEEEFDTEQAEDDDYDETEYDVIKKKSLRLAVCPYGNAKRKHLFR